ncbi:MAG: AtpZ/AtpI family protein [Polyangia bacterium]
MLRQFRARRKGDLEEAHTDPDAREMLKRSGRFAAVGLEMGIAVIVGIMGGRFLDDYFGTEPLLFWIGFAFGLAAAAKAVIDAARKAKKEIDDDEGSDQN